MQKINSKSFLTVFFDELLEQKLRHLQKVILGQLENSGEQNQHRPHITLGCYDTFSAEELDSYLQAFCSTQRVFSIEMRAVGFFPQTSTVFASPVVTEQLLQLHRELQDHFSQEVLYPHYLLTEQWFSHCTLADRVNKRDIPKVINLLQNTWESCFGSVEGIGVLESDNKPCIDRIQYRFKTAR